MKKYFLATSLLLVLMLVLGGCGLQEDLGAGEGESQPEPTASPTPEPTPTVTPSPTPEPTPSAQFYLDEAETLSEEESYEEALEALDQAIELEPENTAALTMRANTYMQLDDPESALEDYSRVIELEPDSVQALRQRGLIHHTQGDSEAALADFDRLVESGVEDADVYEIRGDLNLVQGDFAAAVADYRMAESLGGTRILLAEDFSDPPENWKDSTSYAGSWELVDGRYAQEVKQQNTIIYTPVEVDYEDVRIEVDTILEENAGENSWGVMCRYVDEDHYYLLEIDDLGDYWITIKNDGEWTTLSSGSSDAISFRKGAENHLSASCIENKLSLAVNGELVDEVQSSAFDSGDVALASAAYDPIGGRVLFDNLILRGPAPAESRVITAENVDNLFEIRSIDVSPYLLSAGAFAPGSHHAAAFGYETVVFMLDADTGDILQELDDHSRYGFGLEFSPDGNWLVSGGSASNINLWNVETGASKLSVSAGGVQVYDAAWSPDGERFAVADMGSSTLTLFDSNGNELTELETAGRGWLWSVAFSEDYLATANDTSNALHIYDSDSLEISDTLEHPGLVAADIEFSPDGSLLVSCHRDGTVNRWATDNWAREPGIDAHGGSWPTGGCWKTAFAKNGDVFFTAGGDGWLHAWDAQSGTKLWSRDFEVFVWDVDISDDGELIMVVLDDGTTHILGLP